MLIDVQDPEANLILNGCFYAIIFLTIISLVPWKSLGAEHLSRMLRWMALPVFGLAILYESVMPSRFDIRIDLLLLLPAYALVVATSIVRWRAWKRPT
jgi:hypothetical protein